MKGKKTSEEYIEIYKELKKNKNIIGSIDTDFFFEFVDSLLKQIEEDCRKK